MVPLWLSKPPRSFVANPKITLPSIEECESATYDNSNPDLDEALIVVTKRDGEKLRATVSRASRLEAYVTWSFKLIFGEKVPLGSNLSTGDVALTITEEGVKEYVTLDKAGEYTFDYEISVTAGDVDSDQVQVLIVRFKIERGSASEALREAEPWGNLGGDFD
jgi:hypothetical protein